MTTTQISADSRLAELIEWIVLLRHRVAYGMTSRRKHRARARAIATVRRTLTNARGLNAGNTHTVFNVGLYLLLLDRDLGYFTDDMLRAVGNEKRRFIAKQEALLLGHLERLIGALIELAGIAAGVPALMRDIALTAKKATSLHRCLERYAAIGLSGRAD